MPAGTTIGVAIIDDNRLVREALTALLGRFEDLRVVGSADAGTEFLGEMQPQVVLLDAGLRDRDSLDLAASMRTLAPSARVIIMDVLPVNEEILEFVNVGVAGFVLKDASLEDFVSTVRAVAAGGKVLPERMTESLFAQIANGAGGRQPEQLVEAVRMTPREREVIALIGEGLSNKEIASGLGIATHTVKSHVRNVMEKLTLHSRLQIAAYAHRDGQP